APSAPQSGGAPPPAAPLPPAVPDAYRPGLPYGADEGATQYIPPVPQGRADEGATQFLPPVSGGALPPEAAGHHGGRPGGDADATQYIPPYGAQQGRHGQPGQQGGGERQPPAEFDNLFRGDPAGGVAGSTQQMPRVQDAHPYPGSGPAPLRQRRDDGSMDDDGYGGGGGGRGGGGGGRGRSRVPLIAAIGVGIVVVGVGAGALLSGGDGDGGSGDGKTAAATAPADPSGSPSASSDAADPAKEQAVALDKLLGDSGGSRATVVRSVENIKRCDSLPQAASDLRGAAKQRAGLVTSLGKLSVDKLPNNAALTAALTAAWKASAAADSHYAAWADQTAGKKGCKDGHARTTPQVQAGNRESGTASAQKAKAAALWNAIAGKYGLTQRQPIQL
ncbi:hypothetical protein KUM39_25940, partial [Streptomyces sp. J2-1]|nr:hypothetical protein [Streptomyces corallincola]